MDENSNEPEVQVTTDSLKDNINIDKTASCVKRSVLEYFRL